MGKTQVKGQLSRPTSSRNISQIKYLRRPRQQTALRESSSYTAASNLQMLPSGKSLFTKMPRDIPCSLTSHCCNKKKREANWGRPGAKVFAPFLSHQTHNADGKGPRNQYGTQCGPANKI